MYCSRYHTGDWHRSVHVWVYAQDADSLLIQKRAACKESWPSLWDVSAAGHGMQSMIDNRLFHLIVAQWQA